MLDDGQHDQMVRTIIDLAHGFGLTVVAEGVETAQHADRLREFGCDVLQGYHYSKPLTAADFTSWLAQQAAEAGSG